LPVVLRIEVKPARVVEKDREQQMGAGACPWIDWREDVGTAYYTARMKRSGLLHLQTG
jgi:hypothetical protein